MEFTSSLLLLIIAGCGVINAADNKVDSCLLKCQTTFRWILSHEKTTTTATTTTEETDDAIRITNPRAQANSSKEPVKSINFQLFCGGFCNEMYGQKADSTHSFIPGGPLVPPFFAPGQAAAGAQGAAAGDAVSSRGGRVQRQAR
ncbi:uncharacterized protein LOC126267413 [Schistocerca gregaria]|uniref:uncharacterized protein LOC126267413 n=1 Tax=Schistocerca gregaria TaxID=7010 RepID=UPI00211E45FD|nr:uncharacterized protein LOC126267413 [Schistocerca gregaria]